MTASSNETLRQRLSRGRLSVDEALRISRTIACEIETLHEKGTVHGNLTPETVRVSDTGNVELTSPRAETADPKSDIGSFGALLFEMLSGQAQASQPDWKTLPQVTPPQIRSLLERCLGTDSSRRLFDIGDAALEIDDVLQEKARPARATNRRREMVFGGLALLFLLTTAVGARDLFVTSQPDSPTQSGAPASAVPAGPPSVRFDLLVPFNPIRQLGAAPPNFFLSPDGKKIAFRTAGATAAGVEPRIWVRSLDSPSAESIASTIGTAGIIGWSGDSQRIAFVQERELKKVLATGGPAEKIGDVDVVTFGGLAWNSEGVILMGQRNGPILRVLASGTPEAVTELGNRPGEKGHFLPNFLPDGRHFTYITGTPADRSTHATYVGELASSKRIPLPGIASEAKYLNGHLIFVRDGALVAQPFDPDRLALTGDVFTIASPFVRPENPAGPFSVSSTGTLAFAVNPTASAVAIDSELVWFDRKGATRDTAGPRGEFLEPQLSPDGKFVAFLRGRTSPDIWVLDTTTGSTDRLTSDPAPDFIPRWSPDSKRIAFSSIRDGGMHLYERTVGVVGSDKLLLQDERQKRLSDWSPDGNYLVYIADNDIWALPTTDNSTPIRITNTPFVEQNPRVSPNGKWIVFSSDEKGKSEPSEVYVQSFPKPGVKQIISQGGGLNGQWSRSGEEVFFLGSSSTVGSRSTLALADMLMATSVKSGSALNIGVAEPLFSIATTSGGRNTVSGNYSVLADNRFLVQHFVREVTAPAAPQPTASTRGITVITNWNGRR